MAPARLSERGGGAPPKESLLMLGLGGGMPMSLSLDRSFMLEVVLPLARLRLLLTVMLLGKPVAW